MIVYGNKPLTDVQKIHDLEIAVSRLQSELRVCEEDYLRLKGMFCRERDALELSERNNAELRAKLELSGIPGELEQATKESST